MKSCFTACLLLIANVAVADPVVNPPDPWYVGQLIDVQGSGFTPALGYSILITFSDESTFTDPVAPVNSSGNLNNTSTRIPVGSTGGTATIEVIKSGVTVASDTFEVVDYPSLVVPDPLDAESSFTIHGWGFADYDNEDIFISLVQGEYRWELDDHEPDSYGHWSELFLGDEEDFFGDEATFVASLEDGTILAATTVEVQNAAGTEPVFTPESVPTITVTPPTTFREGDYFDVDVADGIGLSAVTVQVIGDNETVEYQYDFRETNSSGVLSDSLRMPYVLGQGYSVDGRTIRVSHGGYSEDFAVTLYEGVRLGLSLDTFQEGDTIDAEIRNGASEAEVIFQIVHDDDVVVHEFGYTETDGSGYGEFELTIPTVLPPTSNVDGYTFRAIHAGIVIDKSVTIEDGLRVVTGQENVREGHTLYVTVFNGTPSTSVTMDWYHDESFVQSQSGSFSTNGAGLGEFSFTVPDLIQSSADSDLYTLKVTHDGNTFELDITIYQAYTPDPGDPLVTGLVNGNQSNSIYIDSLLGLVQLVNRGATLADLYWLVDPDVYTDSDFYRVLGYSSNRVPFPQLPLDEINIDDLLAALNETSYGNLSYLPVDDDPRYFLKERTQNQLVILIHGKGGTNSDPKAGMNAVYNIISGQIASGHVLRVESGNFEYGTTPAYDFAMDQIELAISSFEIESVVIAGHSWGGGMAYQIAEDINDIYSGSVEIAGLVYVDAVWPVSFSSVTAFPDDVSSILNIYQSEIDSFSDLANGVSISNPGLAGFDGTAYYGRYREFDADGDGQNSTHVGIDEDHASDVANFILHVLDEWYWAN